MSGGDRFVQRHLLGGRKGGGLGRGGLSRELNPPICCWLNDCWLLTDLSALLATAHSPARGGVCALIVSMSCNRESGLLPGEESAQVTRRPPAEGAGLASEDQSRSIESAARCRKPSFFRLTNPVVTFPQPRPCTSPARLDTWPAVILLSCKII